MTTTTTPAAVLAAEIRRLAAPHGDLRVMAWRDRATREEVHASAAELNAAIDRLWEMAEGAQGEAVVYPPDGTTSPFTVINLGAGAVQMGECVHDRRLPALWFGKGGQGIGHEEEMNREAKPGETIAVVTFSNVEGLDVLADVVQRIRTKSFPRPVEEVPIGTYDPEGHWADGDAPVAAKQAEPDPVTEACRLPALVRKRIDAAATAMSWAMAFNDLGAEADGFARALEGLRSLQANDTPAPAAVAPHVLGVGIYHPATFAAAPTPPASTDRAMGAEGRLPLTVDPSGTPLNDACVVFLGALPGTLDGAAYNGVKPAIKAAIEKYLAASGKTIAES